MGISVQSSGDSGQLAKGITTFSKARDLVWNCDSHREGGSGNGVSGKMGKYSKAHKLSEGDARGQYQNVQAYIKFKMGIFDICGQNIPRL